MAIARYKLCISNPRGSEYDGIRSGNFVIPAAGLRSGDSDLVPSGTT